MKKNFIIMVLLAVAVVLIPACSENDDPGGSDLKASFTYSPSTVFVNDIVNFTNTSINAESYFWDFGDKQTSTEISPTHSYSNVGDYTVTLIAYSADGTQSDEATKEIQVTDPTPGPNPPGGSNLTISVNGVSFEMIYVEGGTFWMGAQSTDPNGQNYDPEAEPDESPVHQVRLSDYYIGKFEVTQELWQTVTGSNPSYFTPENGYDDNLQRPVECVRWDMFDNFLSGLNRLTGRTFALPTEAQWEYAARGGNESKHYKYTGSNNVDDVAWYFDNSMVGETLQTHLVGQKQANELGIYDMSGNVWEWCSDRYDEDYRVVRGGSFRYGASNCRVSFRGNSGPDYDDPYGLRLVLKETIDPVASFTYSPSTVFVNDIVTFMNTSINAESYFWNFGDGQTSTQTSPTHTYTAAGNYTVTLIAYSADGTKSDEAIKEIQVTDPSPGPNPPGGSNLTITVNGVSFEMIYVEGGKFDMGATPEQGDDDPYDDEYPVHQVTLSSYYIGEFEVTQALWQAVTGSNPSYFGGLQRPVEQVGWDDIVEDFLPALNAATGRTFALPTEAQWEFAARGGTKSKHYKYSGSNTLDDVAWYWCGSNSGDQTHPVGQKCPNELGIYDMSGNVFEWCKDWYDSDYYQYSPSTNPQGPSTYPNFDAVRVERGGCWNGNADDCRVSNRRRRGPSNGYYDGGFRLVLLP